MDQIIDMARELGEALQQDDRYIRVQTAQTAADEDKDLQDLIGEFNLQRIALNSEAQKENHDEAKMKEHNEKIRDVYQKIMENPSMKAYNEVKPELDALINTVARIITLSAQGEDPYSISEHDHSCGGDCSACGGCH